ncbi:phytoene desaturase family protein [Gracilibacillus dipsosauri]|uniref:FAD-dependent pyridine nucleotide-disulfide oxidoreductase n=1 Tax=Gracilibacillus dipsosauri TaxID=178340 RepID=A0A317KVM9_9BACI|nr:FAD-dependent oxidoreductase [Gracilibacillus dipsosauri]PWU67426.1 FAD-dependent pyridine nucleotide-disulfide oxidoreductase [Gracilibacillus dipsosauri]
MTRKWDVIIVGGGLAGYVAANYLIKTNRSILLIEKGKIVGGRARTTKMNDQCFNLGPHALYKKGKATAILEELDIKLNGSSPRLSGILMDNHIEYAAPFSPSTLFSTQLLNTKERMEWIKVLLKLMTITPEKLANLTFQQWVRQVTQSKMVESLLYTLGRLASYCHAPEKVSAKAILSCVKSAMGGVLYLDGGWQTMINQLHNRATHSGMEVWQHTHVKQIEPAQQKQFQLVLSNGKKILGEHVICTTGPHELNDILSKKMVFPQREFLSQITPIRGATLDIALTQLPNQNQLFAMDIKAPLYYSVHSAFARLSNHPRNAILHVFKYHHPDQHMDGAIIKKELEQFLDVLQPGWQEYVIFKRFLPHITVNQRLPQIGDEQKILDCQTEIPGLYIAGDWASPHSILAEAAITSGKQAAEKVILNEKRHNDGDYKSRLSAI